MEQNKYAAELQKIDKLDKKIAIKEASGLNTETDEREKEIAMLELVEKVAKTEQRKTINSIEFEAKRVVNDIKKQSDNLKTQNLLMLQKIRELIIDIFDTYMDKEIHEIVNKCNFLFEFGFETYFTLDEYCNAYKDDIDCSDTSLYASYPDAAINPENTNKEQNIRLLLNVLGYLKNVTIDIETRLDYTNSEFSQCFSLSSLLYRYLMNISFISSLLDK